MKSTDKKEVSNNDELIERSLTPKKPLLASNNMENMINSLSRPRFMGSIHMKKEAITHSNMVENLIENELKLKMTKSLKNTLFNPVTKILIMLAIIFNLAWLFFIYIL